MIQIRAESSNFHFLLISHIVDYLHNKFITLNLLLIKLDKTFDYYSKLVSIKEIYCVLFHDCHPLRMFRLCLHLPNSMIIIINHFYFYKLIFEKLKWYFLNHLGFWIVQKFDDDCSPPTPQGFLTICPSLIWKGSCKYIYMLKEHS